jgi:hypothetical protein
MLSARRGIGPMVAPVDIERLDIELVGTALVGTELVGGVGGGAAACAPPQSERC